MYSIKVILGHRNSFHVSVHVALVSSSFREIPHSSLYPTICQIKLSFFFTGTSAIASALVPLRHLLHNAREVFWKHNSDPITPFFIQYFPTWLRKQVCIMAHHSLTRPGSAYTSFFLGIPLAMVSVLNPHWLLFSSGKLSFCLCYQGLSWYYSFCKAYCPSSVPQLSFIIQGPGPFWSPIPNSY